MALRTTETGRRGGQAERSKFMALSLGVLLLLAGLLVNQWSIDWILAGEMNFMAARYGMLYPVAVAILQVIFILPALWLLIFRPPLPLPVILHRLLAVGTRDI